MNTFSNAFRTEVVRMARKELKPELQGMRKAITGHRSEIAALKREVKSLTSKVRQLERQVERGHTVVKRAAPDSIAPASASAPRRGRQFVFNHEALIAKRAQFDFTQAEMAKVLHVSSASLYKWETGTVTPRAAQIDRLKEVLKMGVRRARAELAQLSSDAK